MRNCSQNLILITHHKAQQINQRQNAKSKKRKVYHKEANSKKF